MPRACTTGMSLAIRPHEYQASRTISISVIHNIGVRPTFVSHRFCTYFLIAAFSFISFSSLAFMYVFELSQEYLCQYLAYI